MKRPGFSMIELVVALAILGILLAVGAPAFLDTLKKNRLSAQQSDFLSTLATARSEAVKRGQRIFVSGTSPVSGNEFGGGWVLWADQNGNGSRDSTDPVLRQHPDLKGNTLGGGNSANIVFLAGGFLDTTALSLVPLRLKLCDPAQNSGVMFTIMASGLVDLQSEVRCP